MANIKRIDGKTGVSYKITVTRGRDSSGKQIRHYMTWTPPAGMGRSVRRGRPRKLPYSLRRRSSRASRPMTGRALNSTPAM